MKEICLYQDVDQIIILVIRDSSSNVQLNDRKISTMRMIISLHMSYNQSIWKILINNVNCEYLI